MIKSAPIVTLVGRANVGKSSLFNAVVGRREAIVAKEPGTTRDRLTARASWDDKDFWLIDTAGLKEASDVFELSLIEQITQAASAADIICVVVEADVPPTQEDRQVAKIALKSGKQVMLLINKIDKNSRAVLDDWQRLGIKEVFGISAIHKTGIEQWLDAVGKCIPSATIDIDTSRVRVAILGRPNVGKSSLFNALSKKQQAIVSANSGTTRDVNRTELKYHSRTIELMDTAGIRRPGKIDRGVEHFSVLRSLAAIEEADICLLVMDAGELNVQLDQKIAGMVKDAFKGLILVVSKWDAVTKDTHTQSQLSSQIKANFEFVPWAPLIFTSSLSGQNVSEIYELLLEIDESRKQRFKTTELNRWLGEATYAHPPAGLKNYTPKLNYIVQEDSIGWPSFKIFGGHTKYLHWSYKRYLERRFREVWPSVGTPIKFWFIDKHSED